MQQITTLIIHAFDYPWNIFDSGSAKNYGIDIYLKSVNKTHGLQLWVTLTVSFCPKFCPK